MSTNLKSQLLQEIRQEAKEIVGTEHLKILTRVMEMLRISHLALMKAEQRAEVTIIAKRLFDRSQEGAALNQALQQVIRTKLANSIKVRPEDHKIVLKDLYVQFIRSNNVKSKPQSFDIVFCKELTPDLRVLLWQGCLLNQKNSKDFYKYDHTAKRNKIEQDMQGQLQAVIKTLQAKLHIQSRQNALRLVQYLFKKHNKIVPTSKYFLACSLCDALNNYTQAKIASLGGCYISLLDLAQFYAAGMSDSYHMQTIAKALQVVDEQYLRVFQQECSRSTESVIKLFKDFCYSLGTCYLSLNTGHFFIDQLLIKPRNHFDIHLGFAAVILVLNSGEKVGEGDQQPPVQSSVQLINQVKPQQSMVQQFEKARLIQVDTLAKVLNSIYDGIPLFESKFQDISDQMVSRPNRNIKPTVINSILEEYKPKLQKFKPLISTGEVPQPQPTKKVQNRAPCGLIPPQLNLDF